MVVDPVITSGLTQLDVMILQVHHGLAHVVLIQQHHLHLTYIIITTVNQGLVADLQLQHTSSMTHSGMDQAAPMAIHAVQVIINLGSIVIWEIALLTTLKQGYA